MKRLFSMLLVLYMVLTLLPGNVFAAEIVASGECGAQGDNVTWTLDSDGLLTISGSGDMRKNLYTLFYPLHDQVKTIVILPGVTSIAAEAFYCFDQVSSVTIPETVASIGWKAFSQCDALEHIVIPESVTSIGSLAFEGCDQLKQVDCLARITTIEARTFRQCSNLTDFQIPETVAVIGEHAFEQCYQLSEITIPDSVTKIDDKAFFNCTGLKTVSISDHVKEIGKYAFSECTSLSSIRLPKGITKIDSYTFQRCSGLVSAEIPDGVTSIGISAFDGCTSLKDIQIPSSVTQIGDSAFHYCTCLESVALPEGITSIGASLFSDCRSLTSIRIPDSVTTIGDSAFAGCSSLAAIEIPDQVTKLGKSCFYQCTSLRNVNIPNGVTIIDDHTFYGCESLSDITLPYGITYIGISAFSGCKSLTRLDLPGSIGSIDSNAFEGCSGLKSVVFREGITSIGSRAFEDCISLEHIQLPNSIKTIAEYAFNGCRALSSVKYIGSEEEWNSINIMRYNDPLFGAVLTVAPEECPFEISEDFSPRFGLEHTYSFENLNDKISDELIEKVISEHILKYLWRDGIGKEDGTDGQCYGMSLTAAASMVHAYPAESSYENESKSETSKTLSDIGPNWKSTETDLTASEYIKWAQLYQSYPICLAEQFFKKSFPSLMDAVHSYCNADGEPVLFSFFDRDNSTGHTVLVMGIDHESDTETAILVYDCNTPGHYGRVLFRKEEGSLKSFDYCYYNYHVNRWVTKHNLQDFLYTENDVSNFIGFCERKLTDEDLYQDYTNLMTIDHCENVYLAPLTPQQFDEQFLPVWISRNAADTRVLDASMYWTKTDHVDLVIPEGEADATISFASFDAGVTVTAPGGSTVSLTASEGTSAAAELKLPESDDFSVEYLTAAADDVGAMTIRIEGRGQNVQSALTADGIQVHADEAKDVIVTYAVDDVVLDTVAVGTLHGDMTVTEDKDHLQISGDVEPPAPQDNPFTDVPSDQYYFEPVLWAVNRDPQITNGTSKTTFSPDATCTRGQVVTFLWRAKGCPEPKSAANPFSDVPANAYFYKAVLWANETGVTNGTSPTTFSPDAPCTRAHVVTFLWRAENKPAAGKQNPFTDVPAGQYYTDAVLWAVSKNITNGTGPTTFSPDNPCTRGQIVTFLYRDMK